MNCEDILEILDNGEAGQLEVRSRPEIAAHLSACPACAGQWRAQADFAALPHPQLSPAFVAKCRGAVAADVPRTAARAWHRRYGVVGTLAVMAAAAGMLLATLPHSPGQPGETGRVEPALPNTEEVAAASPVATAEGPPARSDSPPPRESVAASAATGAFTLRVMPLEDKTTDALALAAAQAFHAALVEELRGIPGIRIRRMESAEDDAQRHADYTLHVSVDGPGPGNTLRAMTRVRKPPPNAAVVPVAGNFTPDCAGSASGNCADPEALARSLSGVMRSMVFSGEISPADLHAAIGNAELEPGQRLQALRSLASPRVRHADGKPFIDPGVEALRDPAVIRGAVGLAAVAGPGDRAEVWRRLRGVRSAELVEPLVAAGHLDPEERVRVQAVLTLGADFADDGRARAALETITRQDASPLVRALAQRGLAGDGPWLQYVGAALTDASRPVDQRLEPLFLHLNDSGIPAEQAGAAVARALNDASFAALADVLRAALDAPRREQALVVISRLDSIRHPAITAMLLEAVKRDAEWFERRQLVNQLALRTDDPRVLAALESVAAQDRDAQVRSAAGNAVEKARSSGTARDAAPSDH